MLRCSEVVVWGLRQGAEPMESFEQTADRQVPVRRKVVSSSVVSRGRAPSSPVGGGFKRMLDASVALSCIVFFLPLFVMVALIIRMSSPGPVFYGHVRIGHGGRAFRCWKFRTMVVDGDTVLERHLATVPGARAEWEANRKLRDDPRVTRIGQVLRDYSVDELPQLFNVLFGDMSIVGPRPVVQDELDRYGPAAAAYLAARPGITGLWQTSGRSDTSYERRVELDARYVTEWSLWLDCLIMARTVPVVLGARGAC
jgi:exopolysaccharide production protein ExoY